MLRSTNILTYKGYINIEKLRVGDLVKTFDGYHVPINDITTRDIINVGYENHPKNQLYYYSIDDYPELNETLTITGYCKLLVDSLPGDTMDLTKKICGNIYSKYGKYKLPVCLDSKSTIYKSSVVNKIYYLDLVDEYGIFVNGLLLNNK